MVTPWDVWDFPDDWLEALTGMDNQMRTYANHQAQVSMAVDKVKDKLKGRNR